MLRLTTKHRCNLYLNRNQTKLYKLRNTINRKISQVSKLSNYVICGRVCQTYNDPLPGAIDQNSLGLIENRRVCFSSPQRVGGSKQITKLIFRALPFIVPWFETSYFASSCLPRKKKESFFNRYKAQAYIHPYVTFISAHENTGNY